MPHMLTKDKVGICYVVNKFRQSKAMKLITCNNELSTRNCKLSLLPPQLILSLQMANYS